MNDTIRKAIGGGLSLALSLAVFGAAAQKKEIEVGLIAPMSGPWARQGQS